jgi:hypothetical protein
MKGGVILSGRGFIGGIMNGFVMEGGVIVSGRSLEGGVIMIGRSINIIIINAREGGQGRPGADTKDFILIYK